MICIPALDGGLEAIFQKLGSGKCNHGQVGQMKNLYYYFGLLIALLPGTNLPAHENKT
jgi:hypothetical protein